jgi:hypothetical protein
MANNVREFKILSIFTIHTFDDDNDHGDDEQFHLQ